MEGPQLALFLHQVEETRGVKQVNGRKGAADLCHWGRQRQRRPRSREVSFWYLANAPGRRLLRDTEEERRALTRLGAGLRRCGLLGRLVFLVSGVDLPVEPDSLPLHVVGKEPPATERQVARLVVERPELQRLYAGWLASLHPAAWREVEAMARAADKKVELDLRPAIEYIGLAKVIEQVGADRFLADISPARRREILRRLQEAAERGGRHR